MLTPISFKPVYILLFTGDITLGDIEMLRAACAVAHAPKGPVAFLTEGRWASLPGAARRRDLALVTKEFEHAHRAHAFGNVHVVSNSLISGAFTAIRWILAGTMHIPEPFTSTVKAVTELEHLAARVGMRLPQSLADWAVSMDAAFRAGREPPPVPDHLKVVTSR